MVDKIKIGNFLRELRNENNLTQEEIAEKFGVSSRSVSRWENGNTLPELGILVNLAVFYGVDIKEIIDGERKSENMEKDVIETLTKAADYAKEEKKYAIKSKTVFVSVGTLLIFSIVVLLVWFAKSVPFTTVSMKDISVKSVYRYETEEGYKYFVMYEAPNYTGPTKIKYSYEEGTTLSINMQRTLLSSTNPDLPISTDIIVYECGWERNDNGGRDFSDFDKVTFAGKDIWVKDNNLNDLVPDYVLEYEKYESSNSEISGWVIEEDYLQAFYHDGSSIKWDYDGNTLFDNR